MAWLSDFFYDVYEDLEEAVSSGARWVGDTANGCYTAVADTVSTAWENVSGSLSWAFEALQGDWNESRTPAQIAADSVLSMVPIIDQIFDLRDLCANCKKLREDLSNNEAWLCLCFSLIGLIPAVGSLAKGVLKILLVYIKKFGAGAVSKAIDVAIETVNIFLHNEKVVKLFDSYDLSKCYKVAADKLQEAMGLVSSAYLSSLFKAAADNFSSLIRYLDRLPGIPQDWIVNLNDKYSTMLAIQAKMGENIDSCLGPLKQILGEASTRMQAHALAVGGKSAGNAGTAVAEAATRMEQSASKQAGGAAAEAAGKKADTNPVPTKAETSAQSNAQNPTVEGNKTLGREDMPHGTNAEKGLFGEIVADDHMMRQGHEPLLKLDRHPVDNLLVKGRGAYYVDGVYKNANPPKTYILVEAKYRKNGDFTASNLPTTKGSGPVNPHTGEKKYPKAKQMSDEWIEPRLANDERLDRSLVNKIMDDCERRIIVVDENRNVVKEFLVDESGSIIKP